MKPVLVLLSAAGHKAPPLVDIDGTIFLQLGIFLVLLVILNQLVFKPYLALRHERSKNIEGAREEAGHLETDTTAKLRTYEEQIARARKDAASVRAELRQEGEQQAVTVLGDARAKSEAKVQAAREKLVRSTEAAKLSLRTRADVLARAVVQKLLGREV